MANTTDQGAAPGSRQILIDLDLSREANPYAVRESTRRMTESAKDDHGGASFGLGNPDAPTAPPPESP